jgi:protein-L-isoaspartate(D-aspartate) O-methyltransferase
MGVASKSRDSYALPREAMVAHQLRNRDIYDPRVLRVMADVPRHLFVPELFREVAYEDSALPIGHGQTISQPYMVARMVEALQLAGTERVLDIGTGSGYQAAVLSRFAREVWSIEIVPELAAAARERLARLGYANVQVVTGDGSVGLAEHGPFDAIVVAAASPEVPPELLAQLRPGGRLVIPVGGPGEQVLRLIQRSADATTTESLLLCRFVPLIGLRGVRAEPMTGLVAH